MKHYGKWSLAFGSLFFTSILITSCVPVWETPDRWYPWGFFGVPLSLIGLAIYFLPTIIAAVRRSKSLVGIILVNILTGWTFIGWIIALVWSLAGEAQKR